MKQSPYRKLTNCLKVLSIFFVTAQSGFCGGEYPPYAETVVYVKNPEYTIEDLIEDEAKEYPAFELQDEDQDLARALFNRLNQEGGQ
jgi:hypothetical protein